MFAVKCYYRTSFKTYADNELTGTVWAPRFETIEEALRYAEDAIRKWGYDPNSLRVVKV